MRVSYIKTAKKNPAQKTAIYIHEPYNDDKDVSDSRKKFLEWKAKQNAS